MIPGLEWTRQTCKKRNLGLNLVGGVTIKYDTMIITDRTWDRFDPITTWLPHYHQSCSTRKTWTLLPLTWCPWYAHRHGEVCGNVHLASVKYMSWFSCQQATQELYLPWATTTANTCLACGAIMSVCWRFWHQNYKHEWYNAPYQVNPW